MENNKKAKKGSIFKNLFIILVGAVLLIIGLMITSTPSISNQRNKLWEKEIADDYKQMNYGNNTAMSKFDIELKAYFSEIRNRIPEYADDMTDISSQVGHLFNKFTDIFKKKKNEKALKKIVDKFFKYFPDRKKFEKDILIIYSNAVYKIKKNYSKLSEKILITTNKHKKLFNGSNNDNMTFDKDFFNIDSIELGNKFAKLSLESFIISEIGLGTITYGATRLVSMAIPKSVNPWAIGIQAVALIGGGWFINNRTEKKIIRDMENIIYIWKRRCLSSKTIKNMRVELYKMSKKASNICKTAFQN